MTKFNITVITAAIALAFSTGAMAGNMSKDDYKGAKAGIVTEYKSAVSRCDSFSGNARDICRAEAKGRQDVAKAEFEAGYQPGTRADYNVSIARGQADYSIAKEKCDDIAGNGKDVCRKEATAAQTAVVADAKARLKSANANQVASDKTAKARAKASEKSIAARQDAATEKSNAEYAVAREKCDTFAGETKTTCVKDAKVRFGQS
jgi:hypothetical protein